jgi:coenzyme F420-0:L-glutamate ligase
MMAYALKTRVVRIGDNLADMILEALNERGLTLEDNDIIAITSKVIAIAEGQVVKLDQVKPSEKAKRLAQKYRLQPELAELVLLEADKIYGGVEKAILTLKNGVLIANAGIDNKNAPTGHAVLWPRNPVKSCEEIRKEIYQKTGKCVAVLIVDSGLIPLRIGTVGLALAVAGFTPTVDYRGENDLFDRQIAVTRHAVADDLACTSHLLMGEAKGKTPVVLIRGAPVEYENRVYDGSDLMMPHQDCLFMGTFLASKRSSDISDKITRS